VSRIGDRGIGGAVTAADYACNERGNEKQWYERFCFHAEYFFLF
jgi:hypothetical protein